MSEQTSEWANARARHGTRKCEWIHKNERASKDRFIQFIDGFEKTRAQLVHRVRRQRKINYQRFLFMVFWFSLFRLRCCARCLCCCGCFRSCFFFLLFNSSASLLASDLLLAGVCVCSCVCSHDHTHVCLFVFIFIVFAIHHSPHVFCCDYSHFVVVRFSVHTSCIQCFQDNKIKSAQQNSLHPNRMMCDR